MTIDIASRFPRTSLRDAYVKSKQTERWVFKDLVCSSVTTFYGRSNVGKSYLVSEMLLSLMVEGREFLGQQPVDSTKLWRPAILWTDPGSDEEYGERIYESLPDGVDVEVPMFNIGRTTRPDEWDALTGHLLSEGHNFVVLDNLMGTTGDTNDAGTVTTVFDGLTKLTNRGVPVVVLHHESEHGWPNAGAPPMGASVIVQKSRMWIQVRQTAKRKLRGGNTALIVQGNGMSQPQQIVAEPMAGPNYRVLNQGPWEPTEKTEEKPKQKRKPETFDLNKAGFEYYRDHCQGLSAREAAKKLHEKFPQRQVETWREHIVRGSIKNQLAA